MKLNISLALKVLSIVLSYYMLIFVLSVLGIVHVDTRGEFRWDFEAMFAALYFVWAIFLWKAAKDPKQHPLFISFSIWANLSHGLVMILLGFMRNGELVHLLVDGLMVIIPASFLAYFRSKRS